MEHYPKCKYHKDGRCKVVASEAADLFLGAAWKDSPLDHGIIPYPHSEEYLLEHGLLKREEDIDNELHEHTEHQESEPPKPKRGRPFKVKE